LVCLLFDSVLLEITDPSTATSVLAQNVTYSPGGGVLYAVNIPASTAAKGSGDIYFQISGPSTMSWIGLGQGSAMKGSNIFMIYANAAGTNITLSPRLGAGNSQPSASTAAEVTLLGGSGISNNMMVANVRCKSYFSSAISKC
jgi:Cytochrome domain of cellobiose dehydrogenase